MVYTADGASELPKEYLEVHSGGRSAVLDDFQRLKILGAGSRTHHGKRKDKGHAAQFVELHHQLTGRLSESTDVDPLDSMGVTLHALDDARRQPRSNFCVRDRIPQTGSE